MTELRKTTTAKFQKRLHKSYKPNCILLQNWQFTIHCQYRSLNQFPVGGVA